MDKTQEILRLLHGDERSGIEHEFQEDLEDIDFDCPKKKHHLKIIILSAGATILGALKIAALYGVHVW